ncbi:signal peptide peptidase SppA [Candidatus Babeliales bacterium]|nr:signal peptide peptidase SppA [Candidatus Babeliales bacterium]
MSDNKETKKKVGFFEIIKNIFWLLIFLQFAPIIFANLKRTIDDAISPSTHVGYLNISGMLVDSTFYTKNIQRFLKAPEIKALVVRLDSPGGLPGSAQAIFQELSKFKEKKPVVAFIENIGASAAYNIAIASNHIIATPSALVGSIGVWLQVPPNIKYLAEDWKVKFRNIQSGEFKTSGSPFKDMTASEKKHLQEVSDDSYNQFITDVAKSRNLNVKDHKIWADGKVFTGNQALALKLIDQTGSFQDAIEKIKKEAMIETDIKLIKPKRPTGLMKLFGAQDDSESDITFSSFVSTLATQVVEKLTSKLESPRFR